MKAINVREKLTAVLFNLFPLVMKEHATDDQQNKKDKQDASAYTESNNEILF